MKFMTILRELLCFLASRPKAAATFRCTRLCAQHHILKLDAFHRHQRGAAAA